MKNTTNSSTPYYIIRFSAYLEKRDLKIELILVVLGALGYVLSLLHYNPGEFLFSLSLTALSVFYFFLAFKPFDNGYNTFVSKLIHWGYSVGMIGIMFILMTWPGGTTVQLLGIISQVLALIFYLVLDKAMHKLTPMRPDKLIRALIILALLLLLYLTPQYLKCKALDMTSHGRLESVR